MKVFRVTDTETTGFPPNAGIVQLGWTDVTWEGTQINIGMTTQVLCNPGIPISVGAMAVHHITEKMIVGAPHPSEYLETLEEGVDFSVAHNMKFDAAFLKPKKPTICTYRCAKALISDAPAYKNQVLRYHLFGDSLLTERCEPSHAAGPDSFVTANILVHLLKLSAKLGGDFVGRLVELSNEAQLVEIVSFGKHKGKRWADVPKDYMRWLLANANPDEDVRKTMEHYLK